MAGSWETVTKIKGLDVGGARNNFVVHEAEFTADGADGSVPALQVGSEFYAGLLQRVSIKYGDPAPAGPVLLQVTDKNGVVIANAAGDTISASSDIGCNKAFVGPLYVYVTGNTENGAKAVVSLYVLG